ncbi:hypothetical protein HDV06_005606 [Boothiomyces sp. JEL0866]|nr:hypothetical protein HDV06_005606 [Boothiomyces sp. JEL0866]
MNTCVSTLRKSLSPKLQEFVKSYPSIAKFQLHWGEMDMFGHLNNVWYIRYVESARFAHFEQVLKKNFTETQYKNFKDGTGVGIIVKSISINYRAPALYPDNLIVATKIGNLSNDRYTQYTVLLSETQENIVAETESVIVAYDYDKQGKGALHSGFKTSYEQAVQEFGPQEPIKKARL